MGRGPTQAMMEKIRRSLRGAGQNRARPDQRQPHAPRPGDRIDRSQRLREGQVRRGRRLQQQAPRADYRGHPRLPIATRDRPAWGSTRWRGPQSQPQSPIEARAEGDRPHAGRHPLRRHGRARSDRGRGEFRRPCRDDRRSNPRKYSADYPGFLKRRRRVADEYALRFHAGGRGRHERQRGPTAAARSGSASTWGTW